MSGDPISGEPSDGGGAVGMPIKANRERKKKMAPIPIGSISHEGTLRFDAFVFLSVDRLGAMIRSYSNGVLFSTTQKKILGVDLPNR